MSNNFKTKEALNQINRNFNAKESNYKTSAPISGNISNKSRFISKFDIDDLIEKLKNKEINEIGDKFTETLNTLFSEYNQLKENVNEINEYFVNNFGVYKIKYIGHPFIISNRDLDTYYQITDNSIIINPDNDVTEYSFKFKILNLSFDYCKDINLYITSDPTSEGELYIDGVLCDGPTHIDKIIAKGENIYHDVEIKFHNVESKITINNNLFKYVFSFDNTPKFNVTDNFYDLFTFVDNEDVHADSDYISLKQPEVIKVPFSLDNNYSIEKSGFKIENNKITYTQQGPGIINKECFVDKIDNNFVHGNGSNSVQVGGKQGVIIFDLSDKIFDLDLSIYNNKIRDFEIYDQSEEIVENNFSDFHSNIYEFGEDDSLPLIKNKEVVEDIVLKYSPEPVYSASRYSFFGVDLDFLLENTDTLSKSDVKEIIKNNDSTTVIFKNPSSLNGKKFGIKINKNSASWHYPNNEDYLSIISQNNTPVSIINDNSEEVKYVLNKNENTKMILRHDIYDAKTQEIILYFEVPETYDENELCITFSYYKLIYNIYYSGDVVDKTDRFFYNNLKNIRIKFKYNIGDYVNTGNGGEYAEEDGGSYYLSARFVYQNDLGSQSVVDIYPEHINDGEYNVITIENPLDLMYGDEMIGVEIGLMYPNTNKWIEVDIEKIEFFTTGCNRNIFHINSSDIEAEENTPYKLLEIDGGKINDIKFNILSNKNDNSSDDSTILNDVSINNLYQSTLIEFENNTYGINIQDTDKVAVDINVPVGYDEIKFDIKMPIDEQWDNYFSDIRLAVSLNDSDKYIYIAQNEIFRDGIRKTIKFNLNHNISNKLTIHLFNVHSYFDILNGATILSNIISTKFTEDSVNKIPLLLTPENTNIINNHIFTNKNEVYINVRDVENKYDDYEIKIKYNNTICLQIFKHLLNTSDIFIDDRVIFSRDRDNDWSSGYYNDDIDISLSSNSGMDVFSSLYLKSNEGEHILKITGNFDRLFYYMQYYSNVYGIQPFCLIKDICIYEEQELDEENTEKIDIYFNDECVHRCENLNDIFNFNKIFEVPSETNVKIFITNPRPNRDIYISDIDLELRNFIEIEESGNKYEILDDNHRIKRNFENRFTNFKIKVDVVDENGYVYLYNNKFTEKKYKYFLDLNSYEEREQDEYHFKRELIDEENQLYKMTYNTSTDEDSNVIILAEPIDNNIPEIVFTIKIDDEIYEYASDGYYLDDSKSHKIEIIYDKNVKFNDIIMNTKRRDFINIDFLENKNLMINDQYYENINNFSFEKNIDYYNINSGNYENNESLFTQKINFELEKAHLFTPQDEDMSINEIYFYNDERKYKSISIKKQCTDLYFYTRIYKPNNNTNPTVELYIDNTLYKKIYYSSTSRNEIGNSHDIYGLEDKEHTFTWVLYDDRSSSGYVSVENIAFNGERETDESLFTNLIPNSLPIAIIPTDDAYKYNNGPYTSTTPFYSDHGLKTISIKKEFKRLIFVYRGKIGVYCDGEYGYVRDNTEWSSCILDAQYEDFPKEHTITWILTPDSAIDRIYFDDVIITDVNLFNNDSILPKAEKRIEAIGGNGINSSTPFYCNNREICVLSIDRRCSKLTFSYYIQDIESAMIVLYVDGEEYDAKLNLGRRWETVSYTFDDKIHNFVWILKGVSYYSNVDRVTQIDTIKFDDILEEDPYAFSNNIENINFNNQYFKFRSDSNNGIKFIRENKSGISCVSTKRKATSVSFKFKCNGYTNSYSQLWLFIDGTFYDLYTYRTYQGYRDEYINNLTNEEHEFTWFMICQTGSSEISHIVFNESEISYSFDFNTLTTNLKNKIEVVLENKNNVLFNYDFVSDYYYISKTDTDGKTKFTFDRNEKQIKYDKNGNVSIDDTVSFNSFYYDMSNFDIDYERTFNEDSIMKKLKTINDISSNIDEFIDKNQIIRKINSKLNSISSNSKEYIKYLYDYIKPNENKPNFINKTEKIDEEKYNLITMHGYKNKLMKINPIKYSKVQSIFQSPDILDIVVSNSKGDHIILTTKGKQRLFNRDTDFNEPNMPFVIKSNPNAIGDLKISNVKTELDKSDNTKIVESVEYEIIDTISSNNELTDSGISDEFMDGGINIGSGYYIENIK